MNQVNKKNQQVHFPVSQSERKDINKLDFVNVTLLCEQEQIQAHKYSKRGQVGYFPVLSLFVIKCFELVKLSK